jgi:RNase H-like domain found in reverse transcriptase
MLTHISKTSTQHPGSLRISKALHLQFCTASMTTHAAIKKRNERFEWMEEYTAVLNKLIGIVTSDPVLHRPNYDLPFTLKVDASQYATGAILYQPNEKG